MEPGKFKDTLAREAFNLTPDEAIKQNICILCKQPPRFKTEAGKKEYQISGMCEYCFDELFEEIF